MIETDKRDISFQAPPELAPELKGKVEVREIDINNEKELREYYTFIASVYQETEEEKEDLDSLLKIIHNIKENENYKAHTLMGVVDSETKQYIAGYQMHINKFNIASLATAAVAKEQRGKGLADYLIKRLLEKAVNEFGSPRASMGIKRKNIGSMKSAFKNRFRAVYEKTTPEQGDARKDISDSQLAQGYYYFRRYLKPTPEPEGEMETQKIDWQQEDRIIELLKDDYEGYGLEKDDEGKHYMILKKLKN